MLRLTLLAFLVGCNSKIMGTMPVDTGEAALEDDEESTGDDGGGSGSEGGSSTGGSTGPDVTGGATGPSTTGGGSSSGGSSSGGSASGGSSSGGSSGAGTGGGHPSGGPPEGDGTPAPGLLCRDGSFFDCDLECLPIDPFYTWLGDGYCDEMEGANLDCAELEFDYGDCVDAPEPDDDGSGTGGSTDDGGSDVGSTDDSTTDGGSTDVGSTDDADTTGDGTTDGGTTDGGTTDDGTTDDGATDGGTTDGGTSDDGGTTDEGDPEPDPVVGGDCAEGRVYDCSLNCVFASLAETWIGDGYCEDGTAYDGSYDLYCTEFEFDGGDCDGDATGGDTTGGEEPPEGEEPGAPCGAGRIYDCAGTCGTGTLLWDWSVDDYCDDGTTFMFDLNCEYFDFDARECDPE